MPSRAHVLIMSVTASTVTLLAGCADPVAPADASVLEATTSTTRTSRATRSRDGAARTALSGGAMTVFDASADAFSLAGPNLSADEIRLHDEGDEAFDAEFTNSPGEFRGGLGPVFDNTSCTGCHAGDGRGRPPRGAEPFESMLFRASIPGTSTHGGPAAVPGFGGQLQMRSVTGFTPGVRVDLTYRDSTGTFADGTTYTLQVPTYRVYDTWAPYPVTMMISPRVAPSVFGLGLLEAVPEAVIRALADAEDHDKDGISGRANLVYDIPLARYVLGRFGWKANTGTLLQQTAGAYNGDMGITSSIFPAEPCEGYRSGCERHSIEVGDAELLAATFYQQTLGVPARRGLNDADALAGEEIFHETGCAGCHTSTLPTGRLAGAKAASGGVIHPYTDLLVHDMGPALADGRPDFLAGGTEWRTAPLWGIGLQQTVNGHSNFLHDGRARSLLEAILWHGGEAAASREVVRQLSAADRAKLIAFLESL